jgi:hypothetical protein
MTNEGSDMKRHEAEVGIHSKRRAAAKRAVPQTTAPRPSLLRTLNQIAAECPAIPLATLRWYRFSNPENFNDCVVKFGRRVLIDSAKFAEWVARRAGDAA